MSNYYLTLGISKDADPAKIKKAYRLSSNKYQPEAATTEKSNARKRVDDEIHIQQNLDTAREHKSFFKNSFNRFHSLLDDLFEGDVPGFFEEGLSHDKELYLELLLSKEEAMHGGTFPIVIPVLVPCLACHQTGMLGFALCSHCEGYGRSKEERFFNLVVPAGVYHGMELSMTLEDIGLKNVILNIDIIVDDTYAGLQPK